jgi:hypothetical protein
VIGLDPERTKAAISAAFGGVFYGIYTVAALILAGQAPTRADLLRAAVNVVCAMMAGAMVAYFCALALSGAIPWVSLRDPSMVGFAIGALGWELAPVVYRAAKDRVSKLGGGS